MPTKNQTPLIVAGGIGIASLFFLAERLAKSAYILYGARTEHELFFMNELKEYARDLLISTDDGSNGERGTVVEVLSNFLTRHSSLVTRHLIYACGSRQMLEAISKITADKGVTAYISMEENMACGIGACLGCAVRTKDGYKRVCKEGPVFPIEEIVW
ncbi:MAG: hypothetical protein HZC12_07110 [Nitrospirae bacterium]|nr:hypothetical protein [Nitrospirota bacterium]